MLKIAVEITRSRLGFLNVSCLRSFLGTEVTSTYPTGGDRSSAPVQISTQFKASDTQILDHVLAWVPSPIWSFQGFAFVLVGMALDHLGPDLQAALLYCS